MKFRKILAAFLLSAVILVPAGLSGAAAESSTPQLTAYADDYDYYDLYYDDFDYDDYYDYDDDTPSRSSGEAEEKKFNPVRAFIISLIIALIIAFIVVGSMKAKLKTVHRKNEASDYKKEGSMVLEGRSDSFLYKRVSKTQRSSGK